MGQTVEVIQARSDGSQVTGRKVQGQIGRADGRGEGGERYLRGTAQGEGGGTVGRTDENREIRCDKTAAREAQGGGGGTGATVTAKRQISQRGRTTGLVKGRHSTRGRRVRTTNFQGGKRQG